MQRRTAQAATSRAWLRISSRLRDGPSATRTIVCVHSLEISVQVLAVFPIKGVVIMQSLGTEFDGWGWIWLGV